MAANLTMVRIATKLDDLFNEKIDISDVKTSDDDIITTELNSYAVKSQEKRHIVLIELRGCLRLKEYHW